MRCVIIGGGLSGILGALAVHPFVDEVIVCERTPISSSGARARRAAQQHHPHNVLTRGLSSMESLAPGFLVQAQSSGAIAGDVARDTDVEEFGVTMPKRSLGLSIVTAPLSTLESSLRTSTDTLPGVATVTESVTEVTSEGDHRFRVTTETTERSADLVIDATGSARSMEVSFATSWPRPFVERRSVNRWFVALPLIRPDDQVGDDGHVIILPFGDAPLGVLLAPTSPTTWLLSMTGPRSITPPSDPDALIASALLRAPSLGERLSGARVAGTMTRYTHGSDARVHVRSGELPPGFLLLGEATCALSPVLGQGVSMLAWQAAILRDALSSNGVVGGAAQYLAESQGPVAAAWRLPGIVEAVEALATVTPKFGTRIANGLAKSPTLHHDLVAAWHHVAPPEQILEVVHACLNAEKRNQP